MYRDTEPDNPVAPSDQGSSSGASPTDSEPDSPEISDDAVTLSDQSLLSSGPSTVDPSQSRLRPSPPFALLPSDTRLLIY